MRNYKINFIITNWFIKSICIIGLTGIGTIINLLQPDAISQDNYRTFGNNLVAALQNEGNFDNLVAEIEMAGLTEKLEEEQFATLLAFTDEVFNDLSNDTYNKFIENRKRVLLYHLILGKVTQEDLDRGKILTAEGHTITVYSHNGNNIDKVKDANAKLLPVPDINGEIIEIDKVLFPPDLFPPDF